MNCQSHCMIHHSQRTMIDSLSLRNRQLQMVSSFCVFVVNTEILVKHVGQKLILLALIWSYIT